MSDQIIDFQEWLETAPGRYLLAWEREQMDAAVADIFGYHALQLGIPGLDGLRANRMPHRWLATERPVPPGKNVPRVPEILCEFSSLPFPAASLDLVLLPHILEFSRDPHATLREIERVLVPEGRLVICGLNPVSLWGLRQRRGHLYRRFGIDDLFLPDGGEFIAHWRMGDWLRLLGFEVELAEFGCYRPSVRSERCLERFEWLDRAGQRWWPIFGAAYFIVAVKRVRGMRLLGPAWKGVPIPGRKPVAVVNRTQARDMGEEMDISQGFKIGKR